MTNAKAKAPAAASLEAALVARRYYLDGMQKNEIAESLGLSRFKVARLLDDALASGLVRIQVDMPTDLDLDLGDRVAARYGIRTVIAARAIDDDPGSVTAIIATAAANYLAGLLGSDDVLGISWGKTLTAAVNSFSLATGTDVVQLVGGVTSGARNSDIGGAELVRRLSAKTGGQAFPLHSPLVVGSPEIAQQLRNDPALRATIDRFGDLTIAMVGIGSWAPPNSLVYDETTSDERRQLKALSASADLCGIILDEQGRQIEGVLQGRRIGVTSDELKRVPEKIAVAGGPLKTAAIATALRSDLLTTLITDTRTATRLLDGAP